MENSMKNQDVVIHEGQCGLCIHFAEHHKSSEPELLKIRKTKRASSGFIEECGHPAHAALHLKVNPTSGCDGFAPVN